MAKPTKVKKLRVPSLEERRFDMHCDLIQKERKFSLAEARVAAYIEGPEGLEGRAADLFGVISKPDQTEAEG